jgi:type IX secretion system PorP/SprF family membrane protein
MQLKRFVYIFLIIIISDNYLLAQDIHLVQYNASPQNLNPAQTGLFDGDYRLAGNYRTQWLAIPVPYKTYSFSGDTKLSSLIPGKAFTNSKGSPTLGLLVNSDNAGDSKLTTNQLYASLGYIKKITKDSSQLISFAIQPGISNKNFNTSALSFDNQFVNDAYNPSASSGENFANTSFTYFDIGTGVVYHWRKSNRQYANGGVSFFHLNRPKQSFFNLTGVNLDIKMNISGIAEWPLNTKIGILPTFLYQRQGKFEETIIGASGKYYLAPYRGSTSSISAGLFHRAKDAFIILAGMEYNQFNVGISYDINTSNLANATNNRGAFELSVIYILKKIVPFVAKKRVCPVYM